jgi:hypothetical protein
LRSGKWAADVCGYEIKSRWADQELWPYERCGLWRIYFVENANATKIVATMLCGIVSWQIDDTRIACQGWDRIDHALVPEVREKFRF